MRKKYTLLYVEQANGDNFRIAAKYFGCTQSELLGLLLQLAKLDSPDLLVAGEPYASMFCKHLNEPNQELLSRLRNKYKGKQ